LSGRYRRKNIITEIDKKINKQPNKKSVNSTSAIYKKTIHVSAERIYPVYKPGLEFWSWREFYSLK
jgi:hypothetical protein